MGVKPLLDFAFSDFPGNLPNFSPLAAGAVFAGAAFAGVVLTGVAFAGVAFAGAGLGADTVFGTLEAGPARPKENMGFGAGFGAAATRVEVAVMVGLLLKDCEGFEPPNENFGAGGLGAGLLP